MKKIDLKKPRYVLPLICLPFLLILFHVYRLSSAKAPSSETGQAGLQAEISQASTQITGKGIEDKLEAFRQRYKKSDGYTAVGALDISQGSPEEVSSVYNAREKRMLDSISLSLKRQGVKQSKLQGFDANLPPRPLQAGRSREEGEDRALAELLNKYSDRNKNSPVKQTDPMAIFRAQMAIVDSMNKAAVSPRQPSDKTPSSRSTEQQKPPAPLALKVSGAMNAVQDSSTIFAKTEKREFIQGMIDETLIGYAGSRVSIKLLSEVTVGRISIHKGTILYGLITGFASQRVLLSISSIAVNGEILPVNLEVYDLDGIKGIYVPSSIYREFSRELAYGGVSGLSMESSGDQNQQLMSLLGRMFQSTQGALNKLIRSNKAKINHPSKVYLLDKSQTKNSPSL